MKKATLLLITILIVSCNKNDKKDFFSTQYKIEGNVLTETTYNKIYLNYIIGNEFVLMDSATIIDRKFKFKGYVNHPKKAQLQFYPNGAFFPFILYGENFKINLDENNIMNSTITDSDINNEWNNLKTKSIEIFGSVNYLYPVLQKSRIQNDLTQLKQIYHQIDSIEIQNRKFLLGYVIQNPKSKLNGLILNDLYSQIKNDSLEIIKTAEKLPLEMQKTLDFKTTPY